MGDISDIKDRTPNQDLIDQLECLLARARAGEIRGMLSVIGWADDCVTHGWALDSRNTHRSILAELVIAQHEYITNLGLVEGDSVLSNALSED